MKEKVHKPHPGAQEDFLASAVDELFFGGEAGGGKSWAICQDFLYDADNPHANGILFRRTYPDLEDLIFKAQDHFAGFNPTYNSSKHLFTFPSGARFRFAHLQHIKDIFTHAGQEYTHEYWDELCHFPKLPYVFLMSRLRTTDPNIKLRIRGTGNPDGEGVLWVKDRFVDKLKPYEVGWFKTINDRDARVPEGTPGAMSRMWMPTIRSENKALMDADPDYEARLDQLPESQKQAYKFGIWAQTDQPFQLVKTQNLQDSLNGKVEFRYGTAAVGADYAETKDMCAMCSGRGNQVQRFKEFKGMSTPDFARECYQEHMRYGRDQCFTGVDSVGPGVGVYHALQELGLSDRIEGARYKDHTFKSTYDKRSFKMQFNNWRSQAWWQLHLDFEEGGIDLSPLQGANAYYENLHMLQEELLAHRYDIRNGVCHITPKHELRKPDSIGRSPDRADALVIWNWMRHRDPTIAVPKDPASDDYGYANRKKRGRIPPRSQAEAFT